MMAERIAKCSELKVQENSAWHEIDMGEWEGRTMASLHDEAPKLVARLFDDPASFEYPGGESFACFTARVLKAVDQLLMTHKSGEVVLVIDRQRILSPMKAPLPGLTKRYEPVLCAWRSSRYCFCRFRKNTSRHNLSPIHFSMIFSELINGL
jgi:broad specificity phosphatase PhoE